MDEETSPTLLNTLKFEDVLRSIRDDVVNLAAEFISYASLWQFLAIIIAGIAGFFLSRVPVTRLRKLAESRERPDVVFHAAISSARIVWPVVTAILLWITTPAFEQFGLRNEILRVAASLLNAWIIVRLITSNIRDGMVANTLALLAWLIAALYILRLLQPVTQSLDSTIIDFGGVKFSILRLGSFGGTHESSPVSGFSSAHSVSQSLPWGRTEHFSSPRLRATGRCRCLSPRQSAAYREKSSV